MRNRRVLATVDEVERKDGERCVGVGVDNEDEGAGVAAGGGGREGSGERLAMQGDCVEGCGCYGCEVRSGGG